MFSRVSTRMLWQPVSSCCRTAPTSTRRTATGEDRCTTPPSWVTLGTTHTLGDTLLDRSRPGNWHRNVQENCQTQQLPPTGDRALKQPLTVLLTCTRGLKGNNCAIHLLLRTVVPFHLQSTRFHLCLFKDTLCVFLKQSSDVFSL